MGVEEKVSNSNGMIFNRYYPATRSLADRVSNSNGMIFNIGAVYYVALALDVSNSNGMIFNQIIGPKYAKVNERFKFQRNDL